MLSTSPILSALCCSFGPEVSNIPANAAVNNANQLAISPTCNLIVVAQGSGTDAGIALFTRNGCALTAAGTRAIDNSTGSFGAAFSPDGTCLAVTSVNLGSVSIFSVDQDTCIVSDDPVAIITGIPNSFAVTFASESCLIVGGPDVIKSYTIDPTTCMPISTTTPTEATSSQTIGSNNLVIQIAVSPDKKCIATVNNTNTVTIFPFDSATCSIEPSSQTITGFNSTASVAFSPKCNLLAIADLDGFFPPIPASVTVYPFNPDMCTANTANPITLTGVTVPDTITFSTSGQCLAVVDRTNGILTYAVDQSTCTVNPTTPVDMSTQFTARAVGFTPQDTCLIALDAGTNNIVSYATNILSATVDPVAATICSGQSVQLTTTVTNGTGPFTYSWTPIAGLSDPTIANPIASPTTTTTYTVTVTDTGTSAPSCTVQASTTITVNPTPVLSLTAAPTAVCQGATTSTLTATASGGTAPYTIVFSGTGVPANSQTGSSATITVTPTQTTTYTATVTDANGCSNSSTATVTVNPLPNTPTAGSNSPVCEGATLTLTASSTTANVSFSWTGPNGFTSAEQNPSLPNVTLAAAGTYTVTVTDANGCSSTATTQVTVPVNAPFVRLCGPVCRTVKTSKPLITGRATPKATVYVYANNELIARTKASNCGMFSVRPCRPLRNGCNALVARAVNSAGIAARSNGFKFLSVKARR